MKKIALLFALAMALTLAGKGTSKAHAAGPLGLHFSAGGVHVDLGHVNHGRYGYGGRGHYDWHDTSHYDWVPGHYRRHYDHYDYVPGHYRYHREGHWDYHEGGHHGRSGYHGRRHGHRGRF